MQKKIKRRLLRTVFCFFAALFAVLGTLFFDGKYYAFVSLILALLGCAAFFFRLEKRQAFVGELVLLAVMTSMTVLGRVLFAALPGFKPVTAIVILTALSFGPEIGFLTGAMGALVSNFYFGQGPWTPFQMFTWGLIGFFAGILRAYLKRYRPALLLYGAIAGMAYSLVMDVWTVLWWDGGFFVSRYLAALLAAAPYTILYAVSNVVFLFLLAAPLGKKLDRIYRKYFSLSEE